MAKKKKKVTKKTGKKKASKKKVSKKSKKVTGGEAIVRAASHRSIDEDGYGKYQGNGRC